MTEQELVRRFCEAPLLEETEYDRKSLEGSETFGIPFEGRILRAYSWGEGPAVLLAHGWASRASHMALLARGLARGGYRALAYDGPAHGASRDGAEGGSSNLFEFIRAFAAVAEAVRPLRGAIGHSLGAASAAFALAGMGIPQGRHVSAEKLALISVPDDTGWIIRHFCANSGLAGMEGALIEALEHAFSFRISDYRVANAISGLKTSILLIHDEDDTDIPIDSARIVARGRSDAEFFATKGFGHGRILANRAVLRKILEFLGSGAEGDRL
jgi:pimeloyl-ACP methyl ester carboxylesterase